MANELNGELAFQVGEASYTLRYSIDTIIELEDKLDLSTSEIVARLQGRVKLGFLRTILAAGLAEHHKGLSEKEVGHLMVQIGPVIEVVTLILSAVAKAFPKMMGASTEADPQTAAAGTGSAA